MTIKKSKKKLKNLSRPLDFYFLIVSTILVIPSIYTSNTSDPNMAARLLTLAIVVLILSFLYIIKPKDKRPEFRFLKLLLFPVFLFYTLWMIVAITQAVNWAEGLYDLTKTALSLILLAFAAHIYISNKNSFPFLVKMVLIGSVFATALGLYQYFNNVPGKSGHNLFMALYEVKGLMAHKNQFAISLMLMLPFTFFGILKFKKWWWGLSVYSTLLIFTNIAIMQSRSVWVATLVFILSFGFLWLLFLLKDRLKINTAMHKKAVITVLIIAVLGIIGFFAFQKTEAFTTMKYRFSSLFDSKSHDNQGRLKMWESSWDLAQDNQVFGVGSGNWRIAIVPYYKVKHGSKYQNWRRPHNDFLWILSEKGVLGLVLYLLLFLTIAYYGFKVLLRKTDKDKKLISLLMISGIVAYLATAMFSFPLERINHQVYLMLMMAVIISIYYKKQDIAKPIKNTFYFGINSLAIIISALAIFYSSTLLKSESEVLKIYKAINAGDPKRMIVHANKAFSKYTTVDHFAMPIHVYKGIANIKMKNYKTANEDLQTALGYFPANISVLSNLAIVSAEMDNSKMAIFYLKQSLSLYPNYETSLYNLVNVYYRDKNYQKAYITLLRGNTQTLHRDHLKYMEVLKSRLD